VDARRPDGGNYEPLHVAFLAMASQESTRSSHDHTHTHTHTHSTHARTQAQTPSTQTNTRAHTLTPPPPPPPPRTEYENLLRAQGFDDDVEKDEECPGCRDWYSCLTTPAWDWTADQSDCEHATSGSIYYKSDVRTGDPKKVPHPWRRDNTTDKFDGTRSMGKGCTSYSAASQAR